MSNNNIERINSLCENLRANGYIKLSNPK